MSLFTSLTKRKSSRRNKILNFLLLSTFISITTSGYSNNNNNNNKSETDECNNGISAALGYNAFVQYGVSVASGDTEGPIALGGDLTLDGTFAIASHTGGTYYHNGESQAAALVVNGKIIYKSNQGTTVNQGYVKIGNLDGSIVHDKDYNNARTNTRITAGGFDQNPKIALQRNQEFSSIDSGEIIDFNAAFAELNSTSSRYSNLTTNVIIENGNKITLAPNTVNVLNLTGDQLNNLTNFTYNNKPSKNSPLIINVNYKGDFIWNVLNQAGIGDQEGAFVIYNFYNSSKITLNGGGTVMGTLLAPSSNVIKNSSGNINGQVIAKTYDHLNGELHQHTYDHCEVISCVTTVNAGNDKIACEGETITLTATVVNGSICEEDVLYTWSGPAIVGDNNKQTITVTETGD